MPSGQSLHVQESAEKSQVFLKDKRLEMFQPKPASADKQGGAVIKQFQSGSLVYVPVFAYVCICAAGFYDFAVRLFRDQYPFDAVECFDKPEAFLRT